MYVVGNIEYGFLLAAEPPGPDVTEDGKWRLLRLAGIDRQLQYFRARLTPETVAVPGSDHEVLVIFPHHPALSDEAVASAVAVVGQHLPGVNLVFVREGRYGWSRASTPNADLEVAAAAVAANKAIGGWDESTSIEVEIGARVFEVVMVWNKKQWIAHVTARSR